MNCCIGLTVLRYTIKEYVLLKLINVSGGFMKSVVVYKISFRLINKLQEQNSMQGNFLSPGDRIVTV